MACDTARVVRQEKRAVRSTPAIVLALISVPPMLLGSYGTFVGTLLEPPGGPILISISSFVLLIAFGLCVTVCAAWRHGGK